MCWLKTILGQRSKPILNFTKNNMNSSGSTQLIGALSSLESNSSQFQVVFHPRSSCCVSANHDKFRKESTAREISWHFGNSFIEQRSESWIQTIITANREQHLREDPYQHWHVDRGSHAMDNDRASG